MSAELFKRPDGVEPSAISSPQEGAAARVQQLAEQTARLLDQSEAQNTRRIYGSYWAAWEAHCASIEARPFPGEPVVAASWIAAMAIAGKSISTIRVALAALRHGHAERGEPSPTDDPLVRRALKGARNSHGRPARPKRALRIADLRKVTAELARDERGLRDAAVLLLGWYGAFRRSELCALRWSDLDFGDDEGVAVRLRRSKTDQGGKGRTKHIPYQSDPKLCPVRALQRWQQLCVLRGRAGEESPVFPLVLSSGAIAEKAMTGRHLADMLKERAAVVGLDPAVYSGHSLRRGFATEASRAGKKIEDIQRHLGHSAISTTAGYVEEGTGFGEHNPARGLSGT